ncbi:nuclease-related domain-containing protein [Metabacillus indicus]|uniref:nuclease-related domain-containing protein n=1 Tax=Metabacillus indicus TaxID=246786 RepID=UPI003CEAE0D9
MIKKEKTFSMRILKLQALLRRLPVNHFSRKRIEEDLAKSLAGHYGEKSIEYHLSEINPKDYFLFHDLRMSLDQVHFFQIDILIITKGFILILEVKNMKGILLFDQHYHQLIRTYNGKEEIFADPILQVKRQQNSLKQLLQKGHFPATPIHSLVVIGSKASGYKSIPAFSETVKKNVIHANLLKEKMDLLTLRNPNEIFTKKEMNKVSRFLLKEDTPLNPDVMSQFQIPPSDIRTGVYCPSCFHLPMKRQRGTWKCDECGAADKSAHVKSLEDYALLLSPTISNKECRAFLQIESPSIASKLLVQLNLEHNSSLKYRTYQLTT